MSALPQRQAAPLTGDGESALGAAVIARLEDLLTRQCGCFLRCLTVLEKQQALIAPGNRTLNGWSTPEEDILTLVELKEHIVAEICSIQKSIDPLEAMYCAGAAHSPADNVSALKAALEDLRQQTRALSGRNRELLSLRMAGIRTEINVLRNNPIAASARRSLYHHAGAASLIDIQG